MAINIKDLETERLIREASKHNSMGITETIKTAVKFFLKSSHNRDPKRLAQELLEIGKSCSQRKILDSRTADEILGYNSFGISE